MSERKEKKALEERELNRILRDGERKRIDDKEPAPLSVIQAWASAGKVCKLHEVRKEYNAKGELVCPRCDAIAFEASQEER